MYLAISLSRYAAKNADSVLVFKQSLSSFFESRAPRIIPLRVKAMEPMTQRSSVVIVDESFMSIFRVVGPKKIDRLVTKVRKYGFDVLENHFRCAEKPEFGWWPLLVPRLFCK